MTHFVQCAGRSFQLFYTYFALAACTFSIYFYRYYQNFSKCTLRCFVARMLCWRQNKYWNSAWSILVHQCIFQVNCSLAFLHLYAEFMEEHPASKGANSIPFIFILYFAGNIVLHSCGKINKCAFFVDRVFYDFRKTSIAQE